MRAFLRGLVTGIVCLTGSVGCKRAQESFDVEGLPLGGASLQRYWQLPDFTLTERAGSQINLSGLQGKVWIADFFYTTCPGPCPMLSSRLSDLYKITRNLEGVVLVSISTDPEKDTPDVLKQYAKKFGAEENWLFLTGEKAGIYELANEGFKLGVTEAGGNEKEPITHSAKLVLVDKNGFVRGFYDGLSGAETQKIIGDAQILLKESR